MSHHFTSLFTFKNRSVLGPGSLGDDRSSELSGEGTPSSFVQCPIPIFHFWPLFPFSVAITICSGQYIRNEMGNKTAHHILDNNKSVGKFFGSLTDDPPVVALPTSLSCSGNNGLPAFLQGTRWGRGLVFSFSSKLQT